MCNVQLQQEIDDVVAAFVKDNKQFTAWDITRKIRKSDSGVPHWEVRNVVRSMYDNGNLPAYDRQSVTLPNGSDTFVYSPDNMNPQDYQSNQNDDYIDGITDAPAANITDPSSTAATAKTIPTAQAVQTLAQNIQSSVPTMNISGTIAKPDARGTVCVPSKYIKRLSLYHGDTAAIAISANQFHTLNSPVAMIYSGSDSRVQNLINNGTKVVYYTVDCHQNVRITKATLSMAGIHAGQSVIFTATNDNKIKVWY